MSPSLRFGSTPMSALEMSFGTSDPGQHMNSWKFHSFSGSASYMSQQKPKTVTTEAFLHRMSSTMRFEPITRPASIDGHCYKAHIRPTNPEKPGTVKVGAGPAIGPAGVMLGIIITWSSISRNSTVLTNLKDILRSA